MAKATAGKAASPNSKSKRPAKSAGALARPKKPRPNGRPSIFSTSVVSEICVRIAAGESLRRVCKTERMPAFCTVMRWLAEDEHKGFRDQYARARELQADLLADEVLEIADDGRYDIRQLVAFLSGRGVAAIGVGELSGSLAGHVPPLLSGIPPDIPPQYPCFWGIAGSVSERSINKKPPFTRVWWPCSEWGGTAFGAPGRIFQFAEKHYFFRLILSDLKVVLTNLLTVKCASVDQHRAKS